VHVRLKTGEVHNGGRHYTVEQLCSYRSHCRDFISNIEAVVAVTAARASSGRAVQQLTCWRLMVLARWPVWDGWMDRVHSWSSKCSSFDYRLDLDTT